MLQMTDTTAKKALSAKSMMSILEFTKMWFVAIAAACVNYLLPIKAFIFITFGMVAGDLITGIMAAGKRGEAITSAGLSRSVVKFVMYAVAIVASHAMEHVYFAGAFPLVYTVAGYICVTEFWSLLENVGTVTGADIISVVKGKLMDFKTPKT